MINKAVQLDELSSGYNDRWQELADRAIGGRLLDADEGLVVLRAADEELLDLLAAAYRVRHRYFGNRVHLNFLINAKSGHCGEDCGYCSQSRVSTAEIPRYNIVDEEKILDGARIAAELRAKTSALLRAGGVDRVNHNLNTSRRFYPRICSTHTYQERLDTLKTVRRAGLEICSGGIIGMGEEDVDVVELALELGRLKVEAAPMNFLQPITGTPLAGTWRLNPRYCLKALALFRLANPNCELRIAAGREMHLGPLQALGLYPANSIFVGDYLTTKGQAPEEDLKMIEAMGFEAITE
ncbi:MAG: biotin synthase BioB [Thermoguttaceae bacterium]